MTLLAEWGKPYQVTSEVGYGVITDKAQLSRATRCAVMCIFHIRIWLFASSIVRHRRFCPNGQQFSVRDQGRPTPGQQDTRK